MGEPTSRQARASQWREFRLDAVRHPGRTIASFIGAVAVTLAVAVSYGRERGRYRMLGRQLGIYRGRVMSRTYDPGGTSVDERGPELRLVSLRRGSPADVLKALSKKARSAHYRTPDADGDSLSARRTLYFTPPSGQNLPSLAVTLYQPGETIADLDLEVPAGRTGLSSSLRLYRRKTGFGS